ncbi:hypothetical protein [Novipirellula sp.]|uniref:hypothetical protein n=1 Tax=Novipirellula sp. TaxID=2795430 RepID=UPI00356377F7
MDNLFNPGSSFVQACHLGLLVLAWLCLPVLIFPAVINHFHTLFSRFFHSPT